MKKTRQQLVAARAVRTRQARDRFFKRNPMAHDVVVHTLNGYTAQQIAKELHVSVARVRAYQANFSRGVYDNDLVDCKYL